MTTYSVTALYVVVFMGSCALWLKGVWTMATLLIVVLVLGLCATTFAIEQRETQVLHDRGVQSCRDRQKIAEVVSTSHAALRGFLLGTVDRLKVAVKTEPRGGKLYETNLHAIGVFQSLADSLKSVSITDCNFVVHR